MLACRVLENTDLLHRDERATDEHLVEDRDELVHVCPVLDHLDAYSLVIRSTNGITVAEVASVLFGEGDRNAQEKARRKLNRLVADEKIHRQEGTRGGPTGSEPARYYPKSLLNQGGGGDAA